MKRLFFLFSLIFSCILSMVEAANLPKAVLTLKKVSSSINVVVENITEDSLYCYQQNVMNDYTNAKLLTYPAAQIDKIICESGEIYLVTKQGKLLKSTLVAQQEKAYEQAVKQASYLNPYSSTTPIKIKANATKTIDGVEKGKNYSFQNIVCTPNIDNERSNYYLETTQGLMIPIKNKLYKTLEFECSNSDDIWNAAIICNVLPMLGKYGPQNELRDEIERSALSFISQAYGSNKAFNDPYLENYLYGLVAKISPSRMIDGRPCSINLLVVEDPTPNACAYANGTIVVHTGLLSILHSEDELLGVLAHEMAHYVLDHSIQNINNENERQSRAEKGATAGIIVGAMAGAVIGGEDGADAGMKMGEGLVSAIASSVNEKLGMKYNNAQEYEADFYGRLMLETHGYNPNGQATALTRLMIAEKEERSMSMYFASYSHPALIDRIAESGTFVDMTNPVYEKMVSFAISNTALYKYRYRRFQQALNLVEINIKNKVATDNDYLIKANCLLALYDNDEKNSEALSLIGKAKLLNPSSINIYKAEIIANLRLGHKERAIQLLEDYKKAISNMPNNMYSQDLWTQTYVFVVEDTKWCEQMLIKLRNM